MSVRNAILALVDADRADLACAVSDLASKGERVTAAFRALGEADGVTANFRARRECEAALLAFDKVVANYTRDAQ